MQISSRNGEVVIDQESLRPDVLELRDFTTFLSFPDEVSMG